MPIISAKDPLPAIIPTDKKQINAHVGNTLVIAKLTITGIIKGNITIATSGEVILQGKILGNVKNSGKLLIEGAGYLEGDLDNHGTYTLHGKHNGKKMNLMAGSFTYLTGKGIIDLYAEKGAHLKVDKSAEIHNRNGNTKDAIINNGNIAIGGGSVAKSLISTGKVIFTGSGVFK